MMIFFFPRGPVGVPCPGTGSQLEIILVEGLNKDQENPTTAKKQKSDYSLSVASRVHSSVRYH